MRRHQLSFNPIPGELNLIGPGYLLRSGPVNQLIDWTAGELKVRTSRQLYIKIATTNDININYYWIRIRPSWTIWHRKSNSIGQLHNWIKIQVKSPVNCHCTSSTRTIWLLLNWIHLIAWDLTDRLGSELSPGHWQSQIINRMEE